MPKLSPESAPSHWAVPGYMDSLFTQIGGWDVTFEHDLSQGDMAPFFKGAPGDLCQAHHLGYVIQGRFGIRKADGTEEIFEEGDAFVIEPGHIPLMFEGGRYIAFTPIEEAKQQTEVVMPNLIRYAKEHGIELPAMPAYSPA